MTREVEQALSPAAGEARSSFTRSLWMIEELERSLALVPDDAERHYSLALVHIMRGRFAEAINSLDDAIEADHEHVQALWLLGEMHFKMGHYEKAIGALEVVVTRQPDNLMAITWLSFAYHCLNKRGKAIDTQSILQTLVPDLWISKLKR
jgi:tetratricopeptide (TPR) repeat protein